MLLELVVEDRAQTDPRFRVDVLEGVTDPLNPTGDGYEIDIFNAMNMAIYKLPASPGSIKPVVPWKRTAGAEVVVSLAAVWRADSDAIAMMERQAGEQRHVLLPPMPETKHLKPEMCSFRGIPIEIVDG